MLIDKLLILKVVNIQILNQTITFESTDEIFNRSNGSSTYIAKKVKVPLLNHTQNELAEIIDEYIMIDDSDNLAEVGDFETSFKANSFMIVPNEYTFEKSWIYSKSISGLLLNIIQTNGKIVLQLQVKETMGTSIITISANGLEYEDVEDLNNQYITLKDLVINKINTKSFYSIKTIPVLAEQ